VDVDEATFKTYAYVCEIPQQRSRTDASPFVPIYHIDWESARDTAEAVTEYAREWDKGGGWIVELEAKAVPVASILEDADLEMHDEELADQPSLF
jgi:hypothetical protein